MSTPQGSPVPTIGLARVPAVAAQARRLGALLTSAVPGEADAGAWGQGVVVWPEAAPGWRAVADSGDLAEFPDYGLGEGALPAGTRPWLVQTRLECPRTRDLDELFDRAERLLDAVTSQAIAREMWTGALTAASPWNYAGDHAHTLANPRPSGATGDGGPWLNPHLAADAVAMVGPANHPAQAVGAVEAAAMTRLAGGPVFIHVPPSWLLELSQFGIRAEGDRLTTPLGNVIVADAGYGAAVLLDGSPEACFATGPVQVWVGDGQVLRDPASVVELGTNRLGVWAERPAMHLFDPQTLVGCQVVAP